MVCCVVVAVAPGSLEMGIFPSRVGDVGPSMVTDPVVFYMNGLRARSFLAQCRYHALGVQLGMRKLQCQPAPTSCFLDEWHSRL